VISNPRSAPAHLTRNVAQNTRPSLQVREGLGRRLDMISSSQHSFMSWSRYQPDQLRSMVQHIFSSKLLMMCTYDSWAIELWKETIKDIFTDRISWPWWLTCLQHRHGVIVVVFVNYHILLNIQVANTCRWCTFHSGEAKASVWLHLCRKFTLQNVGVSKWVRSQKWLSAWQCIASFPGRRRNGLATSASSNCYFRCLKVGSTNQISERSHMTTVKPNCVMHWTVAVTPIPFQ